MHDDKLEAVRLELSKISERNWILWRKEIRDGKETKVPYQLSGDRALSTDPKTWSTFEAVRAVQQNYTGIGYALPLNKRLLFVDLDHIFESGHETPPYALEFISKANTYTEKSPSGTGAHVILALSDPLDLKTKSKKIGTYHPGEKYECYTWGRYFTVTGELYGDYRPIRTATPEEAEKLLGILGYPWKDVQPSQRTSFAQRTPQPRSDADTLRLMFSSKNGTKIKTLYDGDTSAYNNDDSSADFALCLHLAYWTDKNAEQMDRLWLGSPLAAREKTQTREDNYRKPAIAKAISQCARTYTEDYQHSQYYGRSSSASSTPARPKPASSEPVLVTFRDVVARPLRWLWENRIPLGKLTLFVGDPDGGKSVMTASMAATVSNGSVWPVDQAECVRGDVIILSAEDDAEDTIKPRLEAAGADMSKVHILQSVCDTDEVGVQFERTFSIKRDLEILEKIAKALPGCRLLIIDPISAYLDETDSHRNAAIRGLLTPLARFASKHGIAIVAIDHLNKNSGEKNAMYRPGGSLAFVAAARAAYIVGRHHENQSRRIVAKLKNNLAKEEKQSGLAYSIVTAANGAPVLAWEPKLVEVAAADILSQFESQEERAEKDWAVDTLRDILSNGPVPATQVYDKCKKARVSPKQAQRAARKLGVTPRKADFEGGWVWELPSDQAVDEEGFEALADSSGETRVFTDEADGF